MSDWLAEQFEQNRSHLRAVAYRMLGSATEADDAVQESWLRLSRSDATQIDNLSGWLTTVVARVCLDMLRSRTSRHEESLDEQVSEPKANPETARNPEQEALLADSVGIALLVVLNRLTPAERLAFVLHDMFAVSFEEIAEIAGRSPDAARQLASRARRRVQGAENAATTGIPKQREVVEAFLTALRAGDFEGIIAVLDPDLVVHFDQAAVRPGAPREIHGARTWAQGAVAFRQFAPDIEPMLVNGTVGLAWAPHGQLARVLQFTIANGKITHIDVVADAERVAGLELAVLPR